MSSSCFTDTWIHQLSSFLGYSIHNYVLYIHHCYMYSPVSMHYLLYSCRVYHRSYYMDYCYMYIPVIPLHDCFPLLILIFLLLDMWLIDTRCVRISATWIQATGAISRIPHLLYIVSRSLVSWYQQSLCPIIVLHVSCIVLVLDILYSSNRMNMT